MELDTGSEQDGEPGAAVGEGGIAEARRSRRRRERSRARSKRSSRAADGAEDQGEAGEADGVLGSSSSGTGSDYSTDKDLLKAHRNARAGAAAAAGRMLPKIIFQLAPENRPEAFAAADAVSSDGWDSEGDRERGRARSAIDSGMGTDGATTDGTAGADSDEGAAVPARIAQKRHRWTPQQDRQLLRWVMAQRIELGTRVQVGGG